MRIKMGTLEILKNDELIAINQDKACRQAYVVKEFRSETGKLLGEIWVKELAADGEKAIAFLNRSKKELDMKLSLTEAGMGGRVLSIRNLCRHCDMESTANINIAINPHATAVFRVKSESTVSVPDINEALEYKKPKRIDKISLGKAKELVLCGAVLLDVRSTGEYANSHLDGAVNVPYTEIHVAAPHLVPNKEQNVIVYCSTGKRSSQVLCFSFGAARFSFLPDSQCLA